MFSLKEYSGRVVYTWSITTYGEQKNQMKNLVLGSLIAIAVSQSAGCIIESNDDTYITASWSIKHFANNTVISCPPGFTTAALYSQPANSDGTLVGSPAIDLFDCSANIGTSGPLAPGLYLSWIEIANDNNTAVYAQSLSTPVDTSPGDQAASFQILEDGGYFQMQWALKGATSNQPLSCAQAGVASNGGSAGIQLQAFVSGSSTSSSDIFNCEDGVGVTDPYLTGAYDVLVDAINPNPVGSAPTISSSIQAPNKVTNLGTVTIPINGM